MTKFQGFQKGTIAMVVVSASLAGWIGIVWWQDRRTGHLEIARHSAGGDGKLQEDVEMQ